MKQFSNNLIFFDTEFSGLNPYTGEILSIGMVKMNGEELYLEIEHKGEVSEWVAKKLLPNLTERKISRDEARKKILAFAPLESTPARKRAPKGPKGGLTLTGFAGYTKPFLISYVAEYDALFLYKLLGVNDQKDNGNRDLPYHWIVLDLASMLFALGKNPTDFPSQDKAALAKELGIVLAKYRPHHALDDAKLLREVYLKMVEDKSE